MYNLWLLSRNGGRVVAIETIWLSKPKVFTMRPFTEKMCLFLLESRLIVVRADINIMMGDHCLH